MLQVHIDKQNRRAKTQDVWSQTDPIPNVYEKSAPKDPSRTYRLNAKQNRMATNADLAKKLTLQETIIMRKSFAQKHRFMVPYKKCRPFQSLTSKTQILPGTVDSKNITQNNKYNLLQKQSSLKNEHFPSDYKPIDKDCFDTSIFPKQKRSSLKDRSLFTQNKPLRHRNILPPNGRYQYPTIPTSNKTLNLSKLPECLQMTRNDNHPGIKLEVHNALPLSLMKCARIKRMSAANISKPAQTVVYERLAKKGGTMSFFPTRDKQESEILRRDKKEKVRTRNQKENNSLFDNVSTLMFIKRVYTHCFLLGYILYEGCHATFA